MDVTTNNSIIDMSPALNYYVTCILNDES